METSTQIPSGNPRKPRRSINVLWALPRVLTLLSLTLIAWLDSTWFTWATRPFSYAHNEDIVLWVLVHAVFLAGATAICWTHFGDEPKHLP